jgi:hypothetical protein
LARPECPSGLGRNTLIGQDLTTGHKIHGVVNASKDALRVGRQDINLLPIRFNFLDLDTNVPAFLDLPWQFKPFRGLTRLLPFTLL